MNITRYTLEDADGNNPDPFFETGDYSEARKYAQLNQCRLIANEFVFDDSSMVDDFTPELPVSSCDPGQGT